MESMKLERRLNRRSAVSDRSRRFGIVPKRSSKRYATQRCARPRRREANERNHESIRFSPSKTERFLVPFSVRKNFFKVKLVG